MCHPPGTGLKVCQGPWWSNRCRPISCGRKLHNACTTHAQYASMAEGGYFSSKVAHQPHAKSLSCKHISQCGEQCRQCILAHNYSVSSSLGFHKHSSHKPKTPNASDINMRWIDNYLRHLRTKAEDLTYIWGASGLHLMFRGFQSELPVGLRYIWNNQSEVFLTYNVSLKRIWQIVFFWHEDKKLKRIWQ